MRVAAIYDIHGNLPALEAVLAEIKRESPDLIVVGGDVVPGPMPAEAMDCLFALEIEARFILGNGEVAVVEHHDGQPPKAVPPAFRPIIQWTAEQLSTAHLEAIQTWPKSLKLDIEPLGRVVFCHATPRDENEIFTRLTSDEVVQSMFAGFDADLFVCGHTHMQFERLLGELRIANTGSVGMPFGCPGACWMMLGPDVRFRHTEYDLEGASRRIKATAYPVAADFAERNVLNPPSEEQMLAIFS